MSSATNRKVANFPFLTLDEFEGACKACLPLFQEEPGRDTSTSVKLVRDSRETDNGYGERTCYLTILAHADLQRAMRLEPPGSGEHEADSFSGMEDDLDEV